MLKTKQTFAHLLRAFSVFLLCAFVAPALSSCHPDPEPELEETNTEQPVGIVDTWEYSSSYSDQEDGSNTELKVVLTFNDDYTGSINQSWTTQSRETSSYSLNMRFNWNTATNSSGMDILKVSYVGGDKNTLVFDGGENVVLWQRKYVLTGNILNIYDSDGDGVFVFNRR